MLYFFVGGVFRFWVDGGSLFFVIARMRFVAAAFEASATTGSPSLEISHSWPVFFRLNFISLPLS